MERDPLHILGQTVADKYRIEKLVGEGGFAVVYRALHTIWNKPVAIKFFNGLASAPVDQREQFQQAFIQEGALLTELSSQTAAIVQARDIGTLTLPDGQWMPFMVLEWLDGAPLDDLLERERAAGKPPWTIEEVCGLLRPVAAALDVAHGRGIAHRDVKPANLFVLAGDARSGRAGVKVLDFGVAKMMSDNTHLKAALAKTGMSLTSFTPHYGAPEQFTRSYGATGPWTDVYALALVAVEMMTGTAPLQGDDIVQLGFATANPEKRPTPRALGVPVNDAVEAVFHKALAVAPHSRYERAAEFWNDLELAVTGTAPVLPVTGPRHSGVSGAPTELAPVTEPGRSTQSTTVGSASSTNGVAAPRSKAGVLSLAGLGVAAAAAVFFVFRGSGAEDRAEVRASAPAPTPSASAPPAPPPEPECPADMAKIKDGQFFQGSDAKDAQDNEKPAHNVSLDAYCIDLHEVTAEKYEACSNVGKCKRASNEVDWPKITAADKKLYSPLCTFGDKEKAQHPINCVSWEMARTYCKAQDKRLPTEAEWEYATRGPDGRVYPWGDEAPTAKHLNACGTECVAWGRKNGAPFAALYQEDDGFATTAPIGEFEAGRSRFGPYDVVGNVWEWVGDWFAEYDAAEKTNPTGPEGGERKVIRGGAFNGAYATWLRPSFRYAQDPNALSYGIGFRCAKPLK